MRPCVRHVHAEHARESLRTSHGQARTVAAATVAGDVLQALNGQNVEAALQGVPVSNQAVTALAHTRRARTKSPSTWYFDTSSRSTVSSSSDSSRVRLFSIFWHTAAVSRQHPCECSTATAHRLNKDSLRGSRPDAVDVAAGGGVSRGAQREQRERMRTSAPSPTASGWGSPRRPHEQRGWSTSRGPRHGRSRRRAASGRRKHRRLQG